MAQRRMFSKEITTSDKFVDMPQSCQLLYFHLGMEADDEGFIGNAKMLSRAYGSNNDDLNILFAKNFLIPFETGVVVIKDWNVNNKLRKDRTKETIYLKEKELLTVDDSGVYQYATNCQPIDNQTATKCPPRIGKDRIGKDRIVEESVGDGQHPQQKNKLQEIIKFYNENISPVTPFVREEIEFDCKDFGYELVQEALRRTVLNSKTSYKYSQAILRDWKSKNYKTLDDVEAELKRNINQQNNTSNQDSSQYDGIF